MTTGCTREYLLKEFADNDTQNITAASMRLFVNCVYDNVIDRSLIVDNLVTSNPYVPLSANMGVVLDKKIESNSSQIQDLDSKKIDETDVYNKTYIELNFYDKSYIDYNFYKKSDQYSKQEIDALFNYINQELKSIQNRIDNIVIKNNLEE